MEQSSIDVVLQCDDLLIEIMIRFPLKEVFESKCVSRKWNNIISDPSFRRRYISQRKKSPLPLIGFFHTPSWHELFGSVNLKRYLSMDFLAASNEGKSMMSQSFINSPGFVVRSSPEGLVLCGSLNFKYGVWNPLQNQWFSLPEPHRTGYFISMGFSCDECDDNGIVNFVVVRCCVKPQVDVSNIVIETFSSRNGKWCKSELATPTPLALRSSLCKVVGGVFYWEAERDYAAAYDPRISNNNHVHVLRLPINEFNITRRASGHEVIRILGQTTDGLLKCALGNETGFEIWILKKKLSEYSFSNIIEISEWILTDTIIYSIFSLNNCLVSAFHPQDSRLIYLRRPCAIYCYNTETRTVELVECDRFPSQANLIQDMVPIIQPVWPPTLPVI